MIRNGKYFVAVEEKDEDFKEIFQRLTTAGAGRPADANGYPDKPWTPETLADAICAITANPNGIDLRTVQLWFQTNQRGIKADNLRSLALIFGCDDPAATSDWIRALTAANKRLSDKRKAAQRAKKRKPPAEFQGQPAPHSQSSTNRFNLAVWTEKLYSSNSSVGLPVIIFTLATSLGLISYTLGLHFAMHERSAGFFHQVGFLWAPNWTFVFLLVLPMYLSCLTIMLQSWKTDWRPSYVSNIATPRPIDNWLARLSTNHMSFWAVALVTIGIASIYNWSHTTLVPLLNGNDGGWPVDWSKIAIYKPEVVSIPSAIAFTALVFAYNGYAAYLFFSGYLLIHTITHDYGKIVRTEAQNGPISFEGAVIGRCMIHGVFQCCALGMIITILMKMQSSYLESNSSNIILWLYADLKSLTSLGPRLISTADPIKSAPGAFYSFFCVIAICGVYVNTTLQLRQATRNFSQRIKTTKSVPSWAMLDFSILMLLVSYFSIGALPGFSVPTTLTILLAFWLVTRPTPTPNLFLERKTNANLQHADTRSIQL